MFAPKVEKAVSVAQQESQFKDFLDQHVFILSDINHDSSTVLKLLKWYNIYVIIFFK